MIKNKNTLINYINNEIKQKPIILNSTTKEKTKEREEIKIIKEYINKFIKEKNSKRYILLPGIRQTGKTTILNQTYQYLLNEKKIPQNQILYTSFEDVLNISQCNIKQLIDTYIENIHNTQTKQINKKIFILLDNIHYDKNWFISGKVLHDRTKNIFLIFTGSNTLNTDYKENFTKTIKREKIKPLKYKQHLKLKYNLKDEKIEEKLENLILKGETEEIGKTEIKINNTLRKNKKYTLNEWNNYLKYGGFPNSINKKEYIEISKNLIEITKEIIYIDMPNIKNFTRENQINTNRLLRLLATQDTGKISHANLAEYINTAQTNVKNIIDTLEKIGLIFHFKTYNKTKKKTRNSRKYYFITSSIKHALITETGTIEDDKLIKNTIATSLFNLSEKYPKSVNIYENNNKKIDIDFLLSYNQENLIPIKIDHENKDKKEIKKAINYYNSNYGIIISNKILNIKKEDNVILINPKTFALI